MKTILKKGAGFATAIATVVVTLGTVPTQLSAQTTTAAASEIQPPLPGPRNCFFMRGPVSGDPYINIAYPDAATFYWGGVFTIPDGAKLRLEGKFPHSRYMSLISYDQEGQPIESIADYLIKPNEGSVNPFIAGADRTAHTRDYSVEIVTGTPDEKQVTGMNLVGETRNTLHAPQYGQTNQQVILYRIYAVDDGADETGNVGMPAPVVTMEDGTELRDLEACKALNFAQPLQLDPAALAVPMVKYYELLDKAAETSLYHPATSNPTWVQQLGRESLYAMYTGEDANELDKRSHGGFYPNLDNQYIRTILNRKLGKVFVVRAKAPTTPRTIAGNETFEDGELRYWSLCSNQGFANTRVNDCVHDEEIPLNRNGVYTVVVSRAEDRPRNAIKECGIAWLPMADDGDGVVDNDVTILQLRNMLGTSDFPHAIQKIPAPGKEMETMGPYFPRGRYMTTSAFEIGLPCLRPRPFKRGG